MPDSQTGPKHVAIIMDGNGRWAQMKGKPRLFGHHAGAKRVIFDRKLEADTDRSVRPDVSVSPLYYRRNERSCS